ncbi:DUF4097 family beta strand repeat-containing protein [Colwellia hornerae]|uniref:DUF4097 family beta strand repeat protein n=1 Tax=Colwellia hornerae TaxID=89402 RepID=A0A5C6Q4F3_9GAMM|nr:DUF4097 family beta strand repeat-containing protein [Colwellia hornerae]TWX48069.1 DUF4097 family beta strand repeat protein [Colwellia hornerae]TWX54888.1 DUF4097 family beta strand repeat protein [Colwellia hornerae]TWX63746.1 DUF4097 family beta strand repeat protein [Colwellia hornerae]
MKHSFKRQFTLATILSLAAITNVYAEVEDTIEKSFAVNEQASLALANINGGVDIQGWDKTEIKITATITAENQADRDRISLDFSENSRGVSVETNYQKQSSWGHNNSSGKVDYTVMVPFGVALTDITLVNGSLEIDNVQGEIKASTVNGAIKVQGLAANLELNSVNGSIKATYLKVDNSIDNIELTTVNGSIKLYMPGEFNAIINAETMHGSIDTAFGLSSEKKMFSGRHLSGTVGSGDITINLESVNGSIKVLKN